MDVDGVDIFRAPDDATGALATRRDMNVDEACVVTAEDGRAAHVDAGETINASVVEARARKAATAVDFILMIDVRRKSAVLLGEATHASANMQHTSLRAGMFW